jgi:hypothetical protein
MTHSCECTLVLVYSQIKHYLFVIGGLFTKEQDVVLTTEVSYCYRSFVVPVGSLTGLQESECSIIEPSYTQTSPLLND